MLMVPWPTGGHIAQAAERPAGSGEGRTDFDNARPPTDEGLPGENSGLDDDAARASLASLDESIPLGDKIFPDFSCMKEPRNCKDKELCDFGAPTKDVCIVTQCGEGKCGLCPGGFSKLVVDGWCAYGCMRGTQMVGGAFVLKTRFGDNGPHCIPATK